jgi:hypothetical protein
VVRAVEFKNGVRVHHETIAHKASHQHSERGEIRDQSSRSRYRAAHVLGNAECDWLAMSLLTWRFPPTGDEVHEAKAKLQRKWRRRWGEQMDAWVMEMHARGVPHFHLFHARDSNFGRACLAARCEVVTRKGNESALIRGGPDYWLRSAWMECIGCDDEPTRRFMGGGIIEMMRCPDGAGRYMSKEAGKKEQKQLPPEYSEGLGRWWWVNPRWKPIARRRVLVDVGPDKWPFPFPFSMVWQKSDLDPCRIDGDAAIVAEASRRHAMRTQSHAALGTEYAPAAEPDLALLAKRRPYKLKE